MWGERVSKGSKEVRWGLAWLQSEDDGYKRTGKDGRWLWTGILKSASASSSLSVKSQESRPSTNADSRQSLSNLYGSDRIRSEIQDFLSDLDTEEESSSVVSHASVTGETSLTRRAYLGAY